MQIYLNTAKEMVTRRLVVALCVSVLFHLVALAKFGMFSSGDVPNANSPLTVSLKNPVAVPPRAAEASVNEIPADVPAQQEPKIATKFDKTRRVTSQSAKAVKPLPVEAVAMNPVDVVPKSSPANHSSGIPMPGLAGPVRRADIEFELFLGAERQSAGVAKHSYIADSGENFGVSVKQQFSEGVTGQSEPWQLEISGSFTKQGLSPLLYETKGATAERLLALKGSPEAIASAPNRSRKGRMPDGILDRQSLLYQFMVQPPLQGGGKLWLTDGVTHGQYSYRLAGYDSLTVTAYGLVRALKLVISAVDGAETIELWLVPDLHYLPVKVRHIDRKGVVTEQMAVSIDFKLL